MSKLKEAKELLHKVESDTNTIRYAVGRAALFGEALKIFREYGDNQKAEEMSWEFLLFRLRYLTDFDERKKSKKRFAPLVEYANGTVFPDIRTFSDQQIKYYMARAHETSNPIHKARYDDIVWELKRDHAFARNAIYAYLECVNIYYENDWQNEIADSLLRAIELALTLNDQPALTTVQKELFRCIETLASAKKFRYCLELIDGIVEMRKSLQDKDLEIAVDIAVSGASFYEGVKDGFHLQQSFLEKLVMLMNALKRPTDALKYVEQIAESLVKEGDWKLEHYPSGDSVAAFFYEKAAKIYQDLGLRDKTNELMKNVKKHTIKAEVGYKKIVTSISIPNEPIRKYIQDLSSLDLSEALRKISLDDSFVPNLSKISTELRKQKGKSLSLVIPRVSIRNGNPVLRSQTEDEILEDSLVERVVMDYKIKGSILGIIIDELIKTKKLNHKNMSSFLSSSWVYESNSKKMIGVGLERYFSGDYISCLHILTPQLERTLRHMLEKMGISTTVLDKDSIKEKPLGSILREPKMKELLGDDISFYISCLLEDKRGDNLRNDIAHGLIAEESCTRNMVNNLLHVFLLLTRFKVD